jgi:hypothetical protein
MTTRNASKDKQDAGRPCNPGRSLCPGTNFPDEPDLLMGEEIGEADEDIPKEFQRLLICIEVRNESLWVMLEKFGGVLSVNLHPRAQNLRIHIVMPLFNQRTSLKPLNQLFGIFNF